MKAHQVFEVIAPCICISLFVLYGSLVKELAIDKEQKRLVSMDIDQSQEVPPKAVTVEPQKTEEIKESLAPSPQSPTTSPGNADLKTPSDTSTGVTPKGSSTDQSSTRTARSVEQIPSDTATHAKAGFQLEQTIRESGVYMPVFAGWTVSRKKRWSEDVIVLSKEGRSIEISLGRIGATEDFQVYPHQQEKLWLRRKALEYERISMGPTTLTFDTAGKVNGYEWSFIRKGDDHIKRFVRIFYYLWKGRCYALVSRSPDRDGKEQVDIEMREMLRLSDAF